MIEKLATRKQIANYIKSNFNAPTYMEIAKTKSKQENGRTNTETRITYLFIGKAKKIENKKTGVL